MPHFHFARMGLAVAVLVAPAGLAAEPLLHRVRTPLVEIEYDTNPAALPLERVELWVTRDDQTWSLHGNDEDRHSPAVFRAEEEGAYGFFVVLVNTTGLSSERPGVQTEPHVRVFVDFTPPVIQLHPAIVSDATFGRVVQIRWTAIDAHFDPRPIVIHHRSEGGVWRPVSDEPLANTGRFDWRLPTDAAGTLRIRAIAADKGGNEVQSDEQVVDISPSLPPSGSPDWTAPTATTGPAIVDDATLPGTPRAKQRVAELIAQAKAHRERGDLIQGIARLREAVRLDPTATQAFVDMGTMLLGAGDAERALSAFHIALGQSPRDRAALLGSALAHRDQQDFPAAAERLRTILRYRPDDAEIWMALGDVAVFQGDELLARECYLRATRIEPGASQVIAEAKDRLALMALGKAADPGPARNERSGSVLPEQSPRQAQREQP